MSEQNAEYACPLCRDTGQVDGNTCPDALARFEQALRERRRSEMTEQSAEYEWAVWWTDGSITRCFDEKGAVATAGKRYGALGGTVMRRQVGPWEAAQNDCSGADQ